MTYMCGGWWWEVCVVLSSTVKEIPEPYVSMSMGNTYYSPSILAVGTLVLVAFISFGTFMPGVARAADDDLKMTGWIPWWQDSQGIKSATKNIDKLDTIYPFAFEVSSDGELVDKAKLSDREWKKLFSLARKNDVEIVPSVMWFDGEEIHAVLSDKRKRDAHIEDIVSMVERGKYDGVNVDYEGKKTETINYFSTFLRDLRRELDDDVVLTCAIEARTPPKDLYTNVPNPLRYANDYEEISRHCDRVELMTYDQQRADLTLNKKRQGLPYNPVADDEWVEKVVDLALEDFDEDQVLLGIPTYGRAWDVVVAPDWYRDYTLAGTLNLPRLRELSKEYKAPEGRSVGGDAVITYFPNTSPYRVLNSLPTPPNTPKGYEAAAKALFFANATGAEVSVRFASYSDAVSAERRLEIAREYDLRGVAFFKIDGEEDPEIWDLF